ncbi:MAG TPA: hypothetical protein VFI25_11715 [Planctomycetota bacterium]|jgi:hypothetical protein|nr:hypothetical protein [Planctomycetota bacterium]
MLPLLLRLPRLAGLQYLFLLLLPVAPFAMVLGTGVAFGQTTYYVNGVTGNTCHDGLVPVPSDLCTPGSPPPTIPGPFKTITAAVQAAANPASGTPVTILVAGVTSGGTPVVYNAALGESFPISVPAETMIRYDAANSTPGTLVSVDGGGTALSVFEFLGPFSAAGGLDGSTLGSGIQAISVRGGQIGVHVDAQTAMVNSITLRNVRFWNNVSAGARVHAGGTSCQASPTFDSCLFTQDTSVGVTLGDHLLLESDEYARVAPIVFNCLFRVEPDAFGVSPRVEHAIRMITSGTQQDRVEGTFIANIIDGFSNVCTSCAGCTQQGIDYGVFADYPPPAFSGSTSAPTFTTCSFQNCGVTGFFASATSGRTFNPTFSNCNFLYNGKRWPCVSTSSPIWDSLRGHGAGFALIGGDSSADFQYCLFAGNDEAGFYGRVQAPAGAITPTQRVRFLQSQSAYNLSEGIYLDAQNGNFGSWLAGGPNLLNTKVDHNGGSQQAGLRLHQNYTSSLFRGNFPLFAVSNLLSFRNGGPGILLHKTPNSAGFGLPITMSFLTVARNLQEGIRGENLTGSALPQVENATIRSNWNGAAAPGGPYDVTGITDALLRWANIAGVSPTFPPSCTFPDGYGTAQNLLCAPQFVNEATDDYHLVADQLQSTSLDTGKNDPVGEDPTTDLEGNPRITDFGFDGPNGNFPGNWADRACYERPN